MQTPSYKKLKILPKIFSPNMLCLHYAPNFLTILSIVMKNLLTALLENFTLFY